MPVRSKAKPPHLTATACFLSGLLIGLAVGCFLVASVEPQGRVLLLWAAGVGATLLGLLAALWAVKEVLGRRRFAQGNQHSVEVDNDQSDELREVLGDLKTFLGGLVDLQSRRLEEERAARREALDRWQQQVVQNDSEDAGSQHRTPAQPTSGNLRAGSRRQAPDKEQASTNLEEKDSLRDVARDDLEQILRVWRSYLQDGNGNFTEQGFRLALSNAGVEVEVLPEDRNQAYGPVLGLTFKAQPQRIFLVPDFTKSAEEVARYFDNEGYGHAPYFEDLRQVAVMERTGNGWELTQKGIIA